MYSPAADVTVSYGRQSKLTPRIWTSLRCFGTTPEKLAAAMALDPAPVTEAEVGDWITSRLPMTPKPSIGDLIVALNIMRVTTPGEDPLEADRRELRKLLVRSIEIVERLDAHEKAVLKAAGDVSPALRGRIEGLGAVRSAYVSASDQLRKVSPAKPKVETRYYPGDAQWVVSWLNANRAAGTRLIGLSGADGKPGPGMAFAQRALSRTLGLEIEEGTLRKAWGQVQHKLRTIEGPSVGELRD
jgi:hypothetical protein